MLKSASPCSEDMQSQLANKWIEAQCQLASIARAASRIGGACNLSNIDIDWEAASHDLPNRVACAPRVSVPRGGVH